jgi:hypothetical protein
VNWRLADKEEEQDAWERIDAFWAGSSLSSRPAIRLVGRRPAGPLHWCGTTDQKQRERTPAWYRVDSLNRLNQRVFMAEAFPAFGVRWGSGLGVLHALAGGRYEYDGRTAWLAPIEGILDREPPEFDPEDAEAMLLAQCCRCAVEAVGRRGFVNPPGLLDPLTALSKLCGERELLLALVDRPGRVRAWATALTRMFNDIVHHYAELAGYGASQVVGGPITEGPAMAVQCDFSVMLSPAMYSEFVVPTLVGTCANMSRTLYHLDGVEQMRFLDQLADVPNLRGIQWNPQTDYRKPMSHIDHLRRIRSKGLLLAVPCDGPDQLVALVKELGPDGLYAFLPEFESRVAAEQALATIERRLATVRHKSFLRNH